MDKDFDSSVPVNFGLNHQWSCWLLFYFNVKKLSFVPIILSSWSSSFEFEVGNIFLFKKIYYIGHIDYNVSVWTCMSNFIYSIIQYDSRHSKNVRLIQKNYPMKWTKRKKSHVHSIWLSFWTKQFQNQDFFFLSQRNHYWILQQPMSQKYTYKSHNWH